MPANSRVLPVTGLHSTAFRCRHKRDLVQFPQHCQIWLSWLALFWLIHQICLGMSVADSQEGPYDVNLPYSRIFCITRLAERPTTETTRMHSTTSLTLRRCTLRLLQRLEGSSVISPASERSEPASTSSWKDFFHSLWAVTGRSESMMLSSSRDVLLFRYPATTKSTSSDSFAGCVQIQWEATNMAVAKWQILSSADFWNTHPATSYFVLAIRLRRSRHYEVKRRGLQGHVCCKLTTGSVNHGISRWRDGTTGPCVL